MNNFRFRIEDLAIEHDEAGKLIEDISFDIPENGIFSILGETGSGKTLLAKAMVGILPFSMKAKGKILYRDGDKVCDILKLNKNEIKTVRGNSLMWVPQNSAAALNPLISCENQMLIPLYYSKRINKRIARERIRDIFNELGLRPVDKILEMYPYQLSGGMKVRLMIALGLLMDTKTLILDEPTKGLDEERCHQFMELINKTRKQRNIKIILITHHILIANQYTSDCAVLNKGKLVASGKTSEIIGSNRKPYIEALWRALPINGMEVIEY